MCGGKSGDQIAFEQKKSVDHQKYTCDVVGLKAITRTTINDYDEEKERESETSARECLKWKCKEPIDPCKVRRGI